MLLFPFKAIFCLFIFLFIYLFSQSDDNNKFIEIINKLPKLNRSEVIKEIKKSTPYDEYYLHIVPPNLFNPLIEIKVDFSYEVILGIDTITYGYLRRNAIRNNWGKLCNIDNKCKLVFFSGYSKLASQKVLKLENKLFNDYVEYDFQNSYLNLTLLSCSIIKYCYKKFPSLKYLIKIDSDVIVNLIALFDRFFPKINPKEPIIMGEKECPCFIRNYHKNKYSKYYIPSFSLNDKIPAYVYGGLMIITKESVDRLYNTILSYKGEYLYKEDVNFGILGKKCNIRFKQFLYKMKFVSGSPPCPLAAHIIGGEGYNTDSISKCKILLKLNYIKDIYNKILRKKSSLISFFMN